MADALQYDWVPQDWAVTDDPADPFGASADASVAIDPIQLPDTTAAPHIDAAGNLVGYQEPERGQMAAIPVAAPVTPDVAPAVVHTAPQAAPVEQAPDPVAYDGGFDQFIQDDAVAPPVEPDLHAQPLDEYAGDLAESPVPEELWKPEAQTQENARVLDMSDEEYLQHVQQQQEKADAYESTRLRKIDEDNRREMEHGREVERLARESTRQKLTDIGTRLEQLSQQHEDPSRWYADRSVPQKMALYASAMISGFLNPGGRNGAIELIQGEIDRDVESQRQNLNAQRQGLSEARGLVAEEYALSGDEFQAAETARLAKYGQAIKGLEQEMQRFDPMGSSAMKYRDGISELKARQAAGAAKLGEEMYKRQFAATDQQLRINKDAREQAELKKKLAGGGQAKAMPPEYWQALYGKAPPVPMNAKDYDHWVRTTKNVRELSGNDVESQTKQAMLEKTRADAAKSAREADQAERGARVIDSEGNDLGRARYGVEGAKEAASMGYAHEKFRKNLARLVDLVADGKKVYKGIGADRWPSERKTEIQVMRVDLANQLAKLRDPTSVNRDSEINAALKEIPEPDGWIESKNPLTRAKTLAKTADVNYDTYLGIHVEDFDPKKSPVRRYEAIDEQLFAAPVAAPGDSPGALENAVERGLDNSYLIGAPGIGLPPEVKAKLRELESKDGN